MQLRTLPHLLLETFTSEVRDSKHHGFPLACLHPVVSIADVYHLLNCVAVFQIHMKMPQFCPVVITLTGADVSQATPTPRTSSLQTAPLQSAGWGLTVTHRYFDSIFSLYWCLLASGCGFEWAGGLEEQPAVNLKGLQPSAVKELEAVNARRHFFNALKKQTE